MNKKKEKQCGDKIGFRNHNKAMNFLAHKFLKLRDFATMKAYKCEHCDRYHIGHYKKNDK